MIEQETTATKRREYFARRDMSGMHIFLYAAAMLSLILVVYGYMLLPGLNVFGHDEVYYYPQWDFKFVEEGRWVNYFLHDLLRSIPPWLCAVLLIVSAWTLFFRVARSSEFDAPYSVLIASTIVLTAPYVEQSIWPATVLPAVVILLVASILANRNVPYPFVYLFCGILLFGAIQTFYFLVPLLFFGRFFNSSASSREQWLALVKHLTWWMIGSGLGVLVVFSILWLKTGNFGIQIAPWRMAQPVQDIPGLAQNVHRVIHFLWVRIIELLQSANVFSLWFLGSLGLIFILRARALFNRRHAYILLFAVAGGFFVFSIPLGARVEQRNLQAFGAAFVLFVAFVPGMSSLGKIVGAVLLLTIGYGFSTYGHSFLEKHKLQTDAIYLKLQQLVPDAATQYAGVAVFGKVNKVTPEARIFNNGPRLRGLVSALGVEKFYDCRFVRSKRCSNFSAGQPLSSVAFASGELELSVDVDNIAIVQFQELAEESVR